MTTPSAPPDDVRLHPHLDAGMGEMTTSGAPPNDIRLYPHLDAGTGEMTTSSAPPNDVRLYPQNAGTNFVLQTSPSSAAHFRTKPPKGQGCDESTKQRALPHTLSIPRHVL
jgi:hypothetical protein